MENKDYEQKRRECWEQFLRLGGTEGGRLTAEAFVVAFDRAYALGRQTETISQEEIERASVEYADKTARQYEVCNSEFVQEIMVAFEQGTSYVLGKQEKDTDTVIQGWVAQDRDGEIYLYENEPKRGSDEWLGRLHPEFNFQEVRWSNDPIEVEIIIKRKKKNL